MREAPSPGRQLVHDLNNRLMVLHGELYLLAAQVPDDSSLRPSVDRVSDALARVQELVRALAPRGSDRDLVPRAALGHGRPRPRGASSE